LVGAFISTQEELDHPTCAEIFHLVADSVLDVLLSGVIVKDVAMICLKELSIICSEKICEMMKVHDAGLEDFCPDASLN
jgi:hypothetical protein